MGRFCQLVPGNAGGVLEIEFSDNDRCCGKPAKFKWATGWDAFPFIWLCAEHYDLAVAETKRSLGATLSWGFTL